MCFNLPRKWALPEKKQTGGVDRAYGISRGIKETTCEIPGGLLKTKWAFQRLT